MGLLKVTVEFAWGEVGWAWWVGLVELSRRDLRGVWVIFMSGPASVTVKLGF